MKPWINEPEKITLEKIGFVYEIVSKDLGKYYIGQKKFWLKRKTKKKGEKRYSHRCVESNWRTYFGSNIKLLADVEKYGHDVFQRKILRICYSKAYMNYLETKFQFDLGVLFDKNSYNKIINCRITQKQLKKEDYRYMKYKDR